MTAARDELARLVTDALIAQGQDERFDAPYVKEESAGAVQVDGWVNPFELADEITKAGYVKPRVTTDADRDDLAAMIDPHAHDLAQWGPGSSEANRLRRVANALKRAEKIMETWELKK